MNIEKHSGFIFDNEKQFAAKFFREFDESTFGEFDEVTFGNGFIRVIYLTFVGSDWVEMTKYVNMGEYTLWKENLNTSF